MQRFYLHLLLVLVVLPMFAGCATEGLSFQYLAPESGSGTAATWPSSPEKPRYQLVGVLEGEDNFSRDESQKENNAVKLLRWIAGIGSRFVPKKQLVRPQAGTVDESGRILVTDVGKSSLFVFDTQNGKLEIWNDATLLEGFQTPIGVAVDKDGFILVADADLGRVFRLSREGKPLAEIGASQLQRPTGLAIDPAQGEIYVADTTAHQVKVFNHEGELLRTIGSPGSAPGQFNRPVYLDFQHRQLYVTDTLNARVQVFTPEGKFLKAVGQRGLYLGNFTHPKGVTSDSRGNIYVTEAFYDYLLIFDTWGQFLMPIGGQGERVGEFFLPAGLWRDDLDRIYIADMFNQRVIVLQLVDTFI